MILVRFFKRKFSVPQNLYFLDPTVIFTLILYITALATMMIQECHAFSKEETVLIEKLRAHFGDKLTHDYMKTDEYLMRWLVARKMDYDKARDMLEKSLKWRKENNIDSIINEKFESFEKQYPTQMNAVGKDGLMPVVTYHFGHWSIRKAAQGGQIPKLVRYMIKELLEKPRIKAEEISKAAGKENSKSIMIGDVSGYSLKEHACLQCFGLYTQFVTLYEDNYPEAVHKVLILNAPTIFEVILEIIRPIMSPASKRDLSVFGVRKAEWKDAVQKLVDPKELPPQYGGSKKLGR